MPLLSRIAPKRPTVAINVTLAALCLFCTQSLAQTAESNSAMSVGKTIEINADWVERDDPNRTAIFGGNVKATLGGIRMTSQEIYVRYDAMIYETAMKDANLPPSLREPATGIIQIDAKRGVLVTLPHNTVAKSDFATFDVKNERLTLSGEVILSRGENAVRGTELIVDLAKGTMKLRSPPDRRVGDRYQRFTPTAK